MGAHGYSDQESLYRFGEGLKSKPETLKQLSDDLKALAKQAREDYPASGSLCDEIEAVGTLVHGSVNIADGWHGLFRRGHRRDVERVENPRKSRRVEETADVGRHMRNM